MNRRAMGEYLVAVGSKIASVDDKRDPAPHQLLGHRDARPIFQIEIEHSGIRRDIFQNRLCLGATGSYGDVKARLDQGGFHVQGD